MSESLLGWLKWISTGSIYYNELTTKSKLKCVRHLPRITLESPIDPASVTTYKFPRPGGKIRIGKHSKGMGSKWNEDHLKVITHFKT